MLLSKRLNTHGRGHSGSQTYHTVLFLVHSTLLKIILSHLDFFISATASFPRDSHFPRWNRDSVSLPERIIWQQCTNPVAPAYIQFPTSAIFSPSVEHKLSINSVPILCNLLQPSPCPPQIIHLSTIFLSIR